MLQLIGDRYATIFAIVLLGVGLWGMLVPTNVVRKLIGMVIFQTSIFLFFIEGSVKDDGTAPVIDPAIGTDPASYVNPIPHLLILTAIVVGVAVLGVAIALAIRIHRTYGTLEEHEILERFADAGEAGTGETSAGRADPGHDGTRGQATGGPGAGDDSAGAPGAGGAVP